MFFNSYLELFTEDALYDYIYPLYNVLEPVLTIIRDISVKLMLFNFSVYEYFVCVDLGTLVFIILFLCACGDIMCWHWQAKIMKIYRKVKRDVEMELGQVNNARKRLENINQYAGTYFFFTPGSTLKFFQKLRTKLIARSIVNV